MSWLVAAVVVAAGRPAGSARRWRGLVAVAWPGWSSSLLVRRAVRRFGGVTGDVYGAAIELSLATLLVSLT